MLVALLLIAVLSAAANAATAIAVDYNCTTYDSTAAAFVLTSAATACSDRYTTAVCGALFSTTPAAGENRPAECYSLDATATPVVFNEEKKQIAVSSCAKHCGYCCESPEYKCENKLFPRTDCSTVKLIQCTDPKWRQILAEDCPNVCGFCLAGGCVDAAIECANDKSICRNVDMQSFVKINCQRTCGYCSTTGTVSAVTVAPGCGAVADSSASCASWVKNGFCNNTFYTVAQRLASCGKSCSFLC